ncbi:ABC transporter substrate-binding protein [Bradyrhizobium arachidis]|uniref:ABC transporter substrate-binding protein n=2 Tax=Bradyrhizobium TaxID=374 RepID=UPI002200B95E|nr:ABC transporter substrate-binding protein [Bradyrhizobium arachidis]MDN4982955.1 ABC transporter substrate-binding protein [Bradyrhizobium sp. WYCCWR 13022]UVO34424.1 ABC transporter substrate-binding protein [Bradyrhizobium arachidis]
MAIIQPSISRRSLIKSGVVLAGSQLISAPFIVKSLADEPVKIGMVNPLTGVLSALAQSEVDGAKYAEAEINKKGGILGRQVQLLVEDSANDVGTGVQKTRKLIDRDNVAVILGDVNSGIAYAMSQVTNEKKIFHIVPGGHTDPITGSNCKWNVFRICNTTTMDANAVTPELVKKFGKKWFFITPDYAYGHTLQDAFIKALKKAGGTYEGDMLPINSTDFSATLIKAKAFKPNVLLNNMGGLTQINCMKQFTQFGMQKEMALGGALFELESIKGCPPDAQAGWWAMEWWWNQPNVPEVVKFVSDFRAATKKTPSARDWFGYVAMHTVRLASDKAKSLDGPKMAKALEDLELPPDVALQPGKVRYRAGDHELMPNIFVGEVHPAKSSPDDVFNAETLVHGEQAAGSVEETGCKMVEPA